MTEIGLLQTTTLNYNNGSGNSSTGNESDEIDPINPASAVAAGLALYVLSFLTFVGNAMVLHAIRTEKSLQTVSNMFIMSLAVADLTVGVFVMPISSAYAITGKVHICIFIHIMLASYVQRRPIDAIFPSAFYLDVQYTHTIDNKQQKAE